jgi:hypothetical protein
VAPTAGRKTGITVLTADGGCGSAAVAVVAVARSTITPRHKCDQPSSWAHPRPLRWMSLSDDGAYPRGRGSSDLRPDVRSTRGSSPSRQRRSNTSPSTGAPRAFRLSEAEVPVMKPSIDYDDGSTVGCRDGWIGQGRGRSSAKGPSRRCKPPGAPRRPEVQSRISHGMPHATEQHSAGEHAV